MKLEQHQISFSSPNLIIYFQIKTNKNIISSRMIFFSKGEGTSKVSGIIDPDCTVDLFWKNSTLFYHFFSKLIIFHLDLE